MLMFIPGLYHKADAYELEQNHVKTCEKFRALLQISGLFYVHQPLYKIEKQPFLKSHLGPAALSVFSG